MRLYLLLYSIHHGTLLDCHIIGSRTTRPVSRVQRYPMRIPAVSPDVYIGHTK
jgi:hypothetical protein